MILRASIFQSVRAALLRIPLWLIVAAVALIGAEVAFAIDGNYASPYASQYDSRSAAIAIPNETWLGMLLLLGNGLLVTFYALRSRRRPRPQAN